MESILIRQSGVSDITEVTKSSGTPEYIYNDNIQKILRLPVYGEARIHTEGTLNIAAKDIYGDERLAWILSVYNGITDNDVIPGMQLAYPDLEAVKLILKI